jgi:hypothetical protein
MIIATEEFEKINKFVLVNAVCLSKSEIIFNQK